MTGPLSAAQTRAEVCSGARTAVSVVRDALDRAGALQPRLNAFTQVFADVALERARDVDARVAQGEVLPLAGVPFAVKDNLCVGPDLAAPGAGRGYGGRTTCASRMLEHYESPFTAACVQRMLDAGAVLIGKTNLDEFAMGSSTEKSIFGPTRNPWDVSRVPGGSSGGSAVAVAAGIVPLALGSDTGGSIRQPAGLCGVVGVKPTYGRVSRWGLVAFASSLDQVGPFARTVGDAALALRVICGYDERDSTSSTHPVPSFDAAPRAGLRVGVPTQARGTANHPGVAAGLERALGALRAAGATVTDVDLPHTDYGIAAYYIIAPAEASSNLARYDGVRFGRRAAIGPGEGLNDLYCRSRGEGFGPEVRRRIMLGTHVLSSGYYDAYYSTALKVRRRIQQDYLAAFASCDVVVMPTTPNPAFRIGEKTADPLAMYLEDVYTVGVNLAGLPGLSVPAGLARVDGVDLPVGVQVIAPAFDEGAMLAAAGMIQRALGAASPPMT